MKKETQKNWTELRNTNKSITLPLRLNAYERICLFLERISPNILIHRVNNNAANAIDLQRAMLADIRTEFEHNIAQQIYISPQAWVMVVKAKEDLVNLIIISGKGFTGNNTNMDLIKAISEKMIKMEESPTQKAMTILKEEISKTF